MADDGFLLGIAIGRSAAEMATTTLHGELLGSLVIPTSGRAGAAAVLDWVVLAAGELAAATEYSSARSLAGVGVVCPGIIGENGVRLAPHPAGREDPGREDPGREDSGWDAVALRRTVATAFPGAPVQVMNDAKAAALAEVTHGRLAGLRSGLFLTLGTGLAAVLVINGSVLDGAHGAAGGMACQLPPGAGLADEVPAFAVQVANLAVALDPERIVLGGGLVRQADVLVPGLRRALARVVPFPPDIELSGLPGEAGLAGALVLAAGPARGLAGLPRLDPDLHRQPAATARDDEDDGPRCVPLDDPVASPSPLAGSLASPVRLAVGATGRGAGAGAQPSDRSSGGRA